MQVAILASSWASTGCTARALDAAAGEIDADDPLDGFDASGDANDDANGALDDDGEDTDRPPGDSSLPPEPGGARPPDEPGELPPDSGVPVLNGAELVEPDVITLNFSHAMVIAEDADLSKFRLSVGYAGGSNTIQGTQTFYFDPALQSGPPACEQTCFEGFCYETCTATPGPTVVVQALEIDSFANIVRVRLSGPADQLCLNVGELLGGIEGFGEFGGTELAGLVLHYDAEPRPALLTLESGVPAASIGAHWVRTDGQESARPGFFLVEEERAIVSCLRP